MTLSRRTIYSIGTGGRSWEIFTQILQEQEIQVVADVRSRPSSKIVHFKGDSLSKGLGEIGIERIFLGKELGGYRRGGYLNHTKSELFTKGMERLESLATAKRCAFLCAETLPWKCHRWHISNELTARGWDVVHLIRADQAMRHEEIPQEGRLWTNEI